MQKPIDFDQIWLEDRDEGETVRVKYMSYDPINRELCFEIPSMKGIIACVNLGEYGSRWRFWAHKPTDEERKAAEWKD